MATSSVIAVSLGNGNNKTQSDHLFSFIYPLFNEFFTISSGKAVTAREESAVVYRFKTHQWPIRVSLLCMAAYLAVNHLESSCRS